MGGFGSAALHPVGTSVARAAGGKNKGLAIGLFSAGGMIGYAIGPVVILYVVSTLGISATAWLMVPGVLLGVLMWFLMPDDERLSGEPSEEDPLEHGHRKLFDASLFFGPVDLLAVSGIMLLAVVPLLAMFSFETGSPAFFVTVALAGGLVYASLPHMILSAQDLAPHAMGAASGMLMGFTSGVAGVLYIVVGRLQEAIGLAPAMVSSYLLMVPASALAYYVLSRHRASLDQ